MASVAGAAQNAKVWRKLIEHLPADAAGGAEILRIGGDGQRVKPALPLADGFAQGRSLGANGIAVRGALHVAARVNASVFTQQGGAHGEIGVGDVGIFHGVMRHAQ